MIRFLLCLVVLLCPIGTQAQTSRINPLKTPWGKDVTPQNVHSEYPRPAMVRKEWQNLNGLWDWKDVSTSTTPNSGTNRFDGKILVPFPIESTLSGVGRHVERIVYCRHFAIPKEWPKTNRILLHFGAVDWEAHVFVNGRPAGEHRGGFAPFTIDITDFLNDTSLNDTGPNELIVRVFDPTNHGQQPRGKQSTSPSGVWYTSVSGIWQTVWLEPVPRDYLRSVRFHADPDTGILTIEPRIGRPRSELTVFAEAFDGDETVARAYGGSEGPLVMKFPEEKLKLWSPDSPHLYQLRIRLLDKDVPVDQVGSYCAFRKVELKKDKNGVPKVHLNGKPLFQMGVIDQGYWPDGLYTAPADAAVRMDIQVAKSLGFNVIRKHLKVEPQRWYYWCDRYGILVWQDMPNGENRSPASQARFRDDLQEMVRFLSNHPSIVLWTVFNEGMGQHRTEEYVALLRRLDPTRLVNAASGWTDKNVGHLNDHHKFPGPEMGEPDGRRASVIGSFGGLTLIPPKKNLWTPDTWGFQHVSDSDTLLARYREMHEELRRMIRDRGLAGAMFHQLSDVESECNGLATYDRVLLKIPPEEFRRINGKTIQLGSPTDDALE